MPFKILPSCATGKHQDDVAPLSQTCFFSLSLPGRLERNEDSREFGVIEGGEEGRRGGRRERKEWGREREN